MDTNCNSKIVIGWKENKIPCEGGQTLKHRLETLWNLPPQADLIYLWGYPCFKQGQGLDDLPCPSQPQKCHLTKTSVLWICWQDTPCKGRIKPDVWDKEPLGSRSSTCYLGMSFLCLCSQGNSKYEDSGTGIRKINIYLMYSVFQTRIRMFGKIPKFSTPVGENLHPHTSNSSMCMLFQRNTLFELKRTKNILLRSLWHHFIVFCSILSMTCLIQYL